METSPLEPSPWGSKQLRRLGEWIRDGGDEPSNAPSYGDVELWYSALAAEVQLRLREHDWRSILGHREIEVSARAKTIDTLRDKLRRDRNTPLSSVQDIAGVRFEAEMTLSQQASVAEAIAEMYGQDPEKAIHDLREKPHSGYRAVHVWLRLPARVEVQVRTRLQGAWANIYEELGDMIGRGIRYGELPTQPELRGITRALQDLGEQTIPEREKLTEFAAWWSDESDRRRFEEAQSAERDLVAELDAIKEVLLTLKEPFSVLFDGLEGGTE